MLEIKIVDEYVLISPGLILMGAFLMAMSISLLRYELCFRRKLEQLRRDLQEAKKLTLVPGGEVPSGGIPRTDILRLLLPRNPWIKSLAPAHTELLPSKSLVGDFDALSIGRGTGPSTMVVSPMGDVNDSKTVPDPPIFKRDFYTFRRCRVVTCYHMGEIVDDSGVPHKFWGDIHTPAIYCVSEVHPAFNRASCPLKAEFLSV